MNEAVVAAGVSKRYGETVAVDDVDLSVADGEVFGLIGPNGAGKTTLVRALTGTTPVDGEITVHGEAPTAVDADRIGLLPQSFSPPARLTARELIDYYGGLYETARDTDEVLSAVGMAAAADSWYETLSGGQQRRVCVGIALVNDPDLLFLDEPTTGIDPAGRQSLWSLLEELADGGTTIVLTSHSMTEIQRLADRVGLLQDGRLVAVGTPAELIESHGGESQLVIDTDQAAAAVDALTDADFAATAGSTEVVVDGVSPVEIGDAVAVLSTVGIEYGSLAWSEPSLEDVYLQLTGETFATAGNADSTTVATPTDAPSPTEAEPQEGAQ
ncbi:ABC transporter ATP-binding protein [Halonotius aquaticus]|uniref:ABC transporter ATP-binding protein n=1 Tax=Halonotius aquaticus TaxID=2216978 RepID=A0A3A6PXV8_9EURY|nr:ABC transporter ATP-binding protein [Halonotius aquaticus]RJX44579.1 ABC transporter ATP-binding protein [Halonotius aquaticus]